jgi:PAB1-binding protein PBP1
LQERELERWKASEDDEIDSEKLTLKSDGQTDWNQWEVNHRMFGVVSTYNPEDYTTKLDESKAEYETFGLYVLHVLFTDCGQIR